jgi:hypothetical protein
MTKLYMPDGREVEQGSPEDMATWWTCGGCGFRGPHVGSSPDGGHRCLGIICGGVTKNPNVPRAEPFASTETERIIANLRERVPPPMEGVPHGGRGYASTIKWQEIVVLLEELDSIRKDNDEARDALLAAEATVEELAASLRECVGTGTGSSDNPAGLFFLGASAEFGACEPSASNKATAICERARAVLNRRTP